MEAGSRGRDLWERMVTPWRFSLRVCLAHLRGFALRKELGLLRPSGGCRKARLCWLLLGTLPKLVSTCEDIGEGAPESVRWQTTSWSDLAKNGPLERVPPEGRLGWLLLHVRIWLRAGGLCFLSPFLLLSPSSFPFFHFFLPLVGVLKISQI